MNYLVAKVIPLDFSYQHKKRFFAHLQHYYWEEPILYKHYADQVIRRCVPEDEMGSSLNHCHTLSCRGHFGGQRIAAKVLQSGSTSLACSRMLTSLYLPVINAKEWGAFPNRMNHPCVQF